MLSLSKQYPYGAVCVAYTTCFPAQLIVAASSLLYWRGPLESGLWSEMMNHSAALPWDVAACLLCCKCDGETGYHRSILPRIKPQPWLGLSMAVALIGSRDSHYLVVIRALLVVKTFLWKILRKGNVFLLTVLPILLLFQLIWFNKQLVNYFLAVWDWTISFHWASYPVWDLAMSFMETICSSE